MVKCRGRMVRSRGGLVDGGGVVRSRGVVGSRVSRGISSTMRSMDRLVGGSMGSSNILLLVVGLVHLIGLGRGLAHHLGVVRAMGLVHSSGDSRGIAVLDTLVAGLVSRGNSQDGENSNKGLKAEIHVELDVLKQNKEQVMWNFDAHLPSCLCFLVCLVQLILID